MGIVGEIGQMVEAGGIEPPSENGPPLLLQA